MTHHHQHHHHHRHLASLLRSAADRHETLAGALERGAPKPDLDRLEEDAQQATKQALDYPVHPPPVPETFNPPAGQPADIAPD